MPILSAIDRVPAGKRNYVMEKISRNSVRLRGRQSAPSGRVSSLEQLIVRLGVIPVHLTGPTAPGAGVMGAHPPTGGTVTITQADASTPATNVINKGDSLVTHTFTVAGAKQVITATFSGNSNTRGRATETI